jgi:sugar phosphate isomerase/epimerase
MKIGLSAYTIRNELASDPIATLEKVAGTGCRTIEFCNIGADRFPESPGAFDVDKKVFKAEVDRVGISVIGSLVLPENYLSIPDIERLYDDYDLMEKIFEFNKGLGGDHVTVGIGFFPSKEYLLRRCDAFNKLGELSNKHGMRLLYHNHYQELQALGECTMLDLIVANTDPNLIGIELDAYWVFRGNLDPVHVMRKYGRRVELLHLKDYPFGQARYIDAWSILDQKSPVLPESFNAIAQATYFIELGEGMVKIQDIIDQGNELNIPYLLVEQDNTSLPSEYHSIKLSLDNMRRMKGLSWDD